METLSEKPKLVLGLVGGIGAGKSSVADCLLRHGGRLIAGDPIGHEALEQPEILARVQEIWGARGVIDERGRVDRKKLGRIVFPSPVERSRLEHLVHPYIEERIRDEIRKAQVDPTAKFIVLDAAVMLEAGWNNVCSKLIYVDAPREIRLQRVKAQRDWSEHDLANREAVQMPPETKKALADVIVDNSGTSDQTATQVETLLREWDLV